MRIERAAWRRVNWNRPVSEIAAAMGVSRQRVHQVIQRLGLPPTPQRYKRARLLALDTTRLTIAEAAAAVGCSVHYARHVFRRARKPCRPVDPEKQASTTQYRPFRKWLQAHYPYTPSTVDGLCYLCRKIERICGIVLAEALARPDGLTATLDLVKAFRTSLLPTDPMTAHLPTYRFAVRRYAESLAASATRSSQTRGRMTSRPSRSSRRSSRRGSS